MNPEAQKYMHDPYLRLSRFLSKDSGGSQVNGNINVKDDYSDDPGIGLTKFYVKPPEGEIFVIHNLLVHVRDDGSFDSGAYGNGIALTNGIIAYVNNDNLPADIDITPEPIKSNPDWSIYTINQFISTYGAGNETMSVLWQFENTGRLMELDGDRGDEFGIKVNDDLSGLLAQYFLVQGKIVKK